MNKKQYLLSMLILGLCVSSIFYNPVFSADKNIYNLEVSRTFERIDNLVDAGNFREAESTVQNLLNQDPKNVKARAALANIYSEQYKIDAAFRELKKAMEIDPNSSDVHNALGVAYYHKTTSSNMEVRNKIPEYYEKALKEFNKAISLNADDSKAYNNAGKIYREMGRLDKAEESFRKAVAVSPNYSEAVMNLGTILYQKNQLDEAASKYYRAIELNKKNSSAYYYLGETLVAKGEYSKAINYLNTSLYLFSNSAPVHNMLGKAYEFQGNEAAAISEYKKATLIKPEYPEPYLSIANIYELRNDNELAISELKNAIAINPDFLEGRLKIADISLRTNDTEQAIKNYKAVMNDPTYSNYALKGLSKAYFVRAQQINDNANFVSDSEYVEVENALKQAIQYNPEDLQLYLALLRMSRLTNQGQLSRSYLNTIVQNPANKPINSVIKGEAYLAYRKYKDAQKEFESALSFVNEKTDILYIGEILMLDGQYEVAKNAFSRVLSTDPDNAQAKKALDNIRQNEDMAMAKYNIAKGFYDEGQKTSAIETLRECLVLNPNLKQAHLLLAKAFEKEGYLFNSQEHYMAYINLIPAYGKEYYSIQKKVESLDNKMNKMKNKGQQIKKFSRI